MSAGLGCIGNVVFGRLSDFLAPAWDEERRSSRAKACPRRANSMLGVVSAWAAPSRSANTCIGGTCGRLATQAPLSTHHLHHTSRPAAARLAAFRRYGGAAARSSRGNTAIRRAIPLGGTPSYHESRRGHGMRCARPQHRGARPPPLLAPLRCSPVELGPRWRVCFSWLLAALSRPRPSISISSNSSSYPSSSS